MDLALQICKHVSVSVCVCVCCVAFVCACVCLCVCVSMLIVRLHDNLQLHVIRVLRCNPTLRREISYLQQHRIIEVQTSRNIFTCKYKNPKTIENMRAGEMRC